MTPSKMVSKSDEMQWVTGRLNCVDGPATFSMVPYPICEMNIYIDKFGGEPGSRISIRKGLPYLVESIRSPIGCTIGGTSVALEEFWDSSNEGYVTRDGAAILKFFETDQAEKAREIVTSLGLQQHLEGLAYVRIEVWPIKNDVHLVGEFTHQDGHCKMTSGEVFRESPIDVINRRIGRSDNWTAVMTVLTLLVWGGYYLSFYVGN